MSVVEASTIAGFRVRRHEPLDILGADVLELEHLATGATLVHFATDDEHLRFEIAFRTMPTDASGAPHILEHCVLYAPSRHWPAPTWANRVLSTGRGAWTGWDFTTYRYSSFHRESFLDMVDPWLDSMLEPVLDENVFRYQAHRLEFEDPDDPATPLRIRGVIYNEQKGIFGLPVYRSWLGTCRALFPGTSYAVEHGGAPAEIPDITLEQLREFHRRHYHPAAALMLTWGDVPIEQLAERISAALDRVEKREFERPEYVPTPRHDAPVRLVEKLPVASGESDRNIVQLAWALGPVSDQRRVVLREVVDRLLMGPGGTLRTRLVDCGLGTSIHETYDRIVRLRMREMVLCFALEGVEPGDEDKVEQVILAELERVASEGFQADAVEAALHSIEFARREMDRNEGSGELDPASIFIGTVLPALSAGAPIIEAIDIVPELERIRAEIETGGRPLEGFVRAALLENQHRALVVVEPDPDADARLAAGETRRLEAARAAMSDADCAELVERNRALQAALSERQRSSSAARFEIPAPLPPADPEPVRLDTGDHRSTGYAARTAGTTHVDLVFDLAGLPADLWDDIALFARSLTQSPLGGLDAAGTAALIGSTTGGVEARVTFDVTGDGERYMPLLTVSGRALERRQDDLVALLAGLVARTRTGDDTVRAVLASAAGAAERDVYVYAPQYLRRRAASTLRRSQELDDRVAGFTGLSRLRAATADGGSAGIRQRLERIRAHVVEVAPVEALVVAAGEDRLAALAEPLATALSEFEATPGPRSLPDRQASHHALGEALVSPSASAFNVRAWAVPADGHPDAAVLQVAANLVTHSYMSPEVMRKGTAYSGRVEYRGDLGLMTAWSIRDPHVARTQRIFEDLPRWLAEEKVDQAALDVARLTAGIEASMPATPVTRSRRAWIEARRGIAPDGRRRRAAGAPSVTVDEIRRVAREHLLGRGVRCSLVPAEMLREAADLFDRTRNL